MLVKTLLPETLYPSPSSTAFVIRSVTADPAFGSVIPNAITISPLSNLLKYAETKTINNTKVQVNIALNYGSKSEIVYALNKLKKSKKGITEQNISKNMYTNKIPDPDLLIRTGNTKRLSNFLLWQIAYSEIYFEKKLWPDFNKNDFNRIIRNFKNIKRNFGNI